MAETLASSSAIVKRPRAIVRGMHETLRRTCVLAALIGGAAASEAAAQARVAVFRAAGFPTLDAPAIASGTLDQALAGSSASAYGSAAALSDALRGGRADVLLLPYGSAFPVEAWPAIRAFVEGGGGLVVLGGAPFAQPVRRATSSPPAGR